MLQVPGRILFDGSVAIWQEMAHHVACRHAWSWLLLALMPRVLNQPKPGFIVVSR